MHKNMQLKIVEYFNKSQILWASDIGLVISSFDNGYILLLHPSFLEEFTVNIRELRW